MKLKRIIAVLLSGAVASSGTQLYAANVAQYDETAAGAVQYAEGDEEERGEVESGESWAANFVYNDETGILSWDEYTLTQEELMYNVMLIDNNDEMRSSFDSNGWGDWRLGKPNINLPVCLALSEDGIFNGMVKVEINVENSDGVLICKASDAYEYEYDGCDVNAELEVPNLLLDGAEVSWNGTNEAVGYLISCDGETKNGFYTYSEEINTFTLWDEFSSIAVCAVDKNGDVSEWSELVTFDGEETPVENPEIHDGIFTYNTKTGILSWENEVDPDLGSSITYNVFANDVYIDIAVASNQSWGFSNATVCLPTSILLYNIKNDVGINGDLAITVQRKDDEVFLPDSFTYTFDGGRLDSDLTVPLIKSCEAALQEDERGIECFYNLNDVTMEEAIDEAVAYLIKASCENYEHITSCNVSEWRPEHIAAYFLPLPENAKTGTELYLQLCTVDINGNYSDWSEPFNFYTIEDGTNEEDIDPQLKVPELQQVSAALTSTNADDNSCSLHFNISNIPSDAISVTYSVNIDGEEIMSSSVDTDGKNEIESVCTFNVSFDHQRDISVKAYISDKNGNRSKWSEAVSANIFNCAESQDGYTITNGIIVNPDVFIPCQTVDQKIITEIGNNAFDFNGDIKTLVISEGVKKIGWYAFNTCENLTEVTLPDSLEYIDSWAFERCNSLKTVNIPKNVTHVGSGAFAQNSSMTSINCDSENKAYVSVDGVLFTKDMKELNAYPGGKSGKYTVPESVNHIGDAAFYGAKKLTAVEISGSLDYIGFEAFAECEFLTDVAINNGVSYVGYWAFRGCSEIKQITVPQSVTNIGNQAFGFQYIDNKYNDFTLKGYKDSAIYYYAVRHDIPFIILGDAEKDNSPFKEENSKKEEVTVNPDADKDDSILNLAFTPSFNIKDKGESGEGLDLDKLKIKAEEIFDSNEFVNKAKEILGDLIEGDNKHVNLLDLSLLYGDEDYSDRYDGLIEISIAVPAGHKDKQFSCYRININEEKMEKELIQGKRVGDNYIIYLEHFSPYAIVGDGDHTHSFRESYESDGENHWYECSCGEKSRIEAHTASEPVIENGIEYTECIICGRLLSKEEVTKPTDPTNPADPTDPDTSTTVPTPSVSPGSFTVPNTSASNSAGATSEVGGQTDETENNNGNTDGAAANGTDISANNTANGSANGNSTSTDDTGKSENDTSDVGGNNADNADNNTDDRNMNTGVTLALIPFAAAASTVLLLSKKKK